MATRRSVRLLGIGVLCLGCAALLAALVSPGDALVLVIAAPVVVSLLWQINDRLRQLVQLRLLDEEERVSERG